MVPAWCGTVGAVDTAVVVIVIVLLVAVVAAVAFVVAARVSAGQKRAERERQRQETAMVMTPDGRVSPTAIKVGDVLAIEGTDHLVVGSVRYEEDGFTWMEHLLEDTSRTWLSVEDDEGVLETVLWRQIKGTGLEPTGQQVTHDGVTYAFDERGRAAYSTGGSTGLPAQGHMEYADYQGPDGKRLGFERFTSGSWEVAAGAVVHPTDLTVWARSADA